MKPIRVVNPFNSAIKMSLSRAREHHRRSQRRHRRALLGHDVHEMRITHEFAVLWQRAILDAVKLALVDAK